MKPMHQYLMAHFRHCPSKVQPSTYLVQGFLGSAIDILGQIRLCCGGLSYAVEDVLQHFWLLLIKCQKSTPSSPNQKWLQTLPDVP